MPASALFYPAPPLPINPPQIDSAARAHRINTLKPHVSLSEAAVHDLDLLHSQALSAGLSATSS